MVRFTDYCVKVSTLPEYGEDITIGITVKVDDWFKQVFIPGKVKDVCYITEDNYEKLLSCGIPCCIFQNVRVINDLALYGYDINDEDEVRRKVLAYLVNSKLMTPEELSGKLSLLDEDRDRAWLYGEGYYKYKDLEIEVIRL